MKPRLSDAEDRAVRRDLSESPRLVQWLRKMVEDKMAALVDQNEPRDVYRGQGAIKTLQVILDKADTEG